MAAAREGHLPGPSHPNVLPTAALLPTGAAHLRHLPRGTRAGFEPSPPGLQAEGGAEEPVKEEGEGGPGTRGPHSRGRDGVHTQPPSAGRLLRSGRSSSSSPFWPYAWTTGKTNTSWAIPNSCLLYQSNPQLVFVLPVAWTETTTVVSDY